MAAGSGLSALQGLEHLPKVLLAVSMFFPLAVALRTNINWDEFQFLSHVYEYQQGLLGRAFQTGYVHLFGWLTWLDGTEVTQIVTARVVYWVLLLLAAMCLYWISRRFVSRVGSLVVCVSFFSFSNVFMHGAAFRADGLALFVYMLCLTVVLGRSDSRNAALLGGGLFGFAVFLTIKSVLLGFSLLPLLLMAPVVAGNYRLSRQVRRLAMFGGAATITCGLLFTAHLASLSSAEDPTGRLLAAGEKTLVSAGFLPQADFLAQSVRFNSMIWSLLVAGLVIVSLRIVRGRDQYRSLQVLSLSLPVLSIFFYRNAFPYYYALIVPPALLLVGVAFDTIAGALKRWPAVALIVPLVIVIDAIPTLRVRTRDTLTQQRVIVATVHRMFPESVPYIDGVSMIASYPKVGFFMSGWGLDNYVQRGEPIFRTLVETKRPAFLLADASDLEVFGHTYRSEHETGSRLLQEDKDFLRDQFVHHWGPVYVPGTEVYLMDGEELRWETLIPGVYTVESDTTISIDGESLAPGSCVYLEAGVHQISVAEGRAAVVLRWGPDLYAPERPPPEPPIFIGF